MTELAVTRLADALVEQVRALVVAEDLPVGARLPSERDLAERFGASRPTVSQALRTLSLMGLVEIRRGSGAYVMRQPETMVTASVNLMLDQDGGSVADLMQLRLWLETLGVEAAAGRDPAASEIAAIDSSLTRLVAAAGDAPAWIAADTVFHAAVVRASGNAYLAALYESVHTAILGYEFRHWVEQDAVPDWLARADPEAQLHLHEPIARAVAARDQAAGRQAVLAHHEVMLDHLGIAH